MDIDISGKFYLLSIDTQKKVFATKWDAIKALRNTLKNDVALIPDIIKLQRIELEPTFQVADVTPALVIRGLLWTDAEIPPDMLEE